MGNLTVNQTANQTEPSAPYNPEWSEINVNISANDGALGLHVTALPGVQTVMLKNYSAYIRAPGNSTYYVTDSALRGGSDVLKRGEFYYNTTVQLSGTNSGYATITFHITSGKLKHQTNYTFVMQFMNPVNYINYEKQKLNPLGTLTWQEAGEVAAGAVVAGLFFRRLFDPIMRKFIRTQNKKGGLILLAKN